MIREPEAVAQVHRIMEKIYDEEKHLSKEERLKRLHQEANALLKRWGLKLSRVSPPSKAASR